MDNLARQETSSVVYHYFGTVIEKREDAFLIAYGDISHCHAKKSSGCLLQPEPGDLVLLVGENDSGFYILTILEREGTHPSRIILDGDSEVVCTGGRLDLAGQEGLGLAASSSINIMAPSLNVTAEQGDCTISRITLLSSFLFGRISRVKLIAGKLEAMYDRIQQKIKRSYREVEDTDHLKAGKIDYTAEHLVSLRGKYSLLTAEEAVKIDGEHIHMG